MEPAADRQAFEVLENMADAVAVVGPGGELRWASRRLVELGIAVSDIPESARVPGEHRLELNGREGRVPVAVTASRCADAAVLLFKDLRPWVGARHAPTRPGRDLARALGGVFRGAMSVSGGEFESTEDAGAVAQVLAEQGRRLIPRTDCLIAIVDPGRPGRFRVAGGAGPWASTLLGHEFAIEGSLVERALAGRRTLETTGAQLETPHGHILASGDIRTSRLVPVVARSPLPDGRTAVGTIGFYSRRRTPFTDLQRRLMDDFAGLVSLSLMRAALRRAARVGAERLTLGLELASDLGRSLDTRTVLGRLLERALDAMAAERAVVLRVEGRETVVEDFRDRDGLPDLIGYRHPIDDQPLMRRAIATRAPVIGGRYAEGSLPERLRGALEAVRHTLTVPLVLAGQVVAVLVISRRRNVAFGADQVATMRLLGSLAVLALRNARLYEEAREADRVRSDFLNMAAHELRTPYTVIAGYLSMLADGSLGAAPPQWRQPLAILEAKSKELGQLVEDLLLAARLDTGSLPVQLQPVDLREAVEEAIERARPRAELVGADLALDPTAEPLRVRADPVLVGRALDNLINNALTYGREGMPWVRVGVRRDRESARIEVEDRGRGISGADRVRVFERFYRVDDARYPQQPGTGLGLYISRELTERQGGRLELEWSRAGEGSRFVLTLPVSRED